MDMRDRSLTEWFLHFVRYGRVKTLAKGASPNKSVFLETQLYKESDNKLGRNKEENFLFIKKIIHESQEKGIL